MRIEYDHKFHSLFILLLDGVKVLCVAFRGARSLNQVGSICPLQLNGVEAKTNIFAKAAILSRACEKRLDSSTEIRRKLIIDYQSHGCVGAVEAKRKSMLAIFLS